MTYATVSTADANRSRLSRCFRERPAGVVVKTTLHVERDTQGMSERRPGTAQRTHVASWTPGGTGRTIAHTERHPNRKGAPTIPDTDTHAPSTAVPVIAPAWPRTAIMTK